MIIKMTCGNVKIKTHVVTTFFGAITMCGKHVSDTWAQTDEDVDCKICKRYVPYLEVMNDA